MRQFWYLVNRTTVIWSIFIWRITWLWTLWVKSFSRTRLIRNLEFLKWQSISAIKRIYHILPIWKSTLLHIQIWLVLWNWEKICEFKPSDWAILLLIWAIANCIFYVCRRWTRACPIRTFSRLTIRSQSINEMWTSPNSTKLLPVKIFHLSWLNLLWCNIAPILFWTTKVYYFCSMVFFKKDCLFPNETFVTNQNLVKRLIRPFMLESLKWAKIYGSFCVSMNSD